MRANQALGQKVTSNHGVFNVWANRERKVGWKRPRCGRPGKQLDSVKALTVKNRKVDRYGLVLAIAVDLVIHAKFMVRQRGLTTPAVSQNLEAFVDQAFIVKFFEGPEHTLGVVGI